MHCTSTSYSIFILLVRMALVSSPVMVSRPDQFNFLFHGLILPKYESVGRKKKKKKKKYESH